MGFDVQVGSVQTKTLTISTPNGWVYWCSGSDGDSNKHWCDWQDDDWLNAALDRQGTNNRIVEFKCRLKNHQVPGCLPGKFISI